MSICEVSEALFRDMRDCDGNGIQLLFLCLSFRVRRRQEIEIGCLGRCCRNLKSDQDPELRRWGAD
jgi:hypothetical protein